MGGDGRWRPDSMASYCDVCMRPAPVSQIVHIRLHVEKKVAPAPPEAQLEGSVDGGGPNKTEVTVTTVTTTVTPVDSAAGAKSENANPSSAAEITVTPVDSAAVATEAGTKSENANPSSAVEGSESGGATASEDKDTIQIDSL